MRQLLQEADGDLLAFRRSYPEADRLLDEMSPDLWQSDEAVAGARILSLLKHGRANEAAACLVVIRREPETILWTFYDLVIAVHRGGRIGRDRLDRWTGLEAHLLDASPLRRGLYHNSMLIVLARMGENAKARAAADRAVELFRAADHPHLEHYIHLHLAGIDCHEGNFRAARRRVVLARDRLRAAAASSDSPLVEAMATILDYEAGATAAVAARAPGIREALLGGDCWIDIFLDLARVGVLATHMEEGRPAALAELDRFRRAYALRHGDADPTLDLIQAQIERMDLQDGEARHIFDAVAFDPPQSAAGRTCLAGLDAGLRHGLDAGRKTDPRSFVLHHLGKAEGASDAAERRSHVEAALRKAAREDHAAPFLEHSEAFKRIASRLASGRFARGDRRLLHLTRRVVRAVPARPAVPSSLRHLGLTRHQHRVVLALQAGRTNKQIARFLGMTEANVKYHLSRLYALTGRRNRKELHDLFRETEASAEN